MDRGIISNMKQNAHSRNPFNAVMHRNSSKMLDDKSHQVSFQQFLTCLLQNSDLNSAKLLHTLQDTQELSEGAVQSWLRATFSTISRKIFDSSDNIQCR